MDKKIKEKIKEITSKYSITIDKNINFKVLTKIVQLRMGQIKEGEVYINNKTKIRFIDQLGNEFEMTPESIKSGNWSPYESGNVRDVQYHMKQLEEIVELKKGQIKKGQAYVNNTTKMTFLDKLGNEFDMIPHAVKRGHWSPYESGNVYNDPHYHMKKIEKIVLLREGKIKEGEIYINNKTKMTFIDQLGNEFKITPNNVKLGYWSPYEKNYSEHICRQIIEQLYNKEFSSTWDIIKRKGKASLQLDGYNNELKIAFEYQGLQHTTGWYNKDKNQQGNNLIELQARDKEKKQICIENNILLLEIDYYKKPKNIQEVIIQTINDVKKSYEINNENIPDFINNLEINKIKIDLSKISHLVLMQKQIEKIVLLKEGKIKEGEKYIHSKAKIKLIDKLGNEFEMTPEALKAGHWSAYESGNVRDPQYHMKKLEEIVQLKGGKIKEGEVYINSTTKITFLDKLGNEFKMRPDSVKSGYWSPYESGIILNPEYHMKQLEEIIQLREGKIKKGEIYINSTTKMTFIDQLGNEFKITPNNVKLGYWSPYESGRVRNDAEYHMKQLEEIIHLREGKIKKGEVYINNTTKMTFIDKLENEFKMTPKAIKRGYWSRHSEKICNHNNSNKPTKLSIKK